MDARLRQWKEDAGRGWRVLWSGAALTAEAALRQREMLTIRLRLARINQKLDAAYRALGRQVTDNWGAERPLLSEEERLTVFSRIGPLREAQKKMMDDLHDWESAPE